jgi:hypothetical protein
MVNGRPAENSFLTELNKKGAKAFVSSLKKKIDVSGKQYATGQVNKEGLFHGKYKDWCRDGNIYDGST